ncbi:hypothetical protein DFH06DRAFT_1185134, partial [Mycena polygramma]
DGESGSASGVGPRVADRQMRWNVCGGSKMDARGRRQWERVGRRSARWAGRQARWKRVTDTDRWAASYRRRFSPDSPHGRRAWIMGISVGVAPAVLLERSACGLARRCALTFTPRAGTRRRAADCIRGGPLKAAGTTSALAAVKSPRNPHA